MQTKKVLFGIVLPLLIVALVLGYLYKNHKTGAPASPSPVKQQTAGQAAAPATAPSADLPISATDPNVQNVMTNYSPTLIRYMLTGTIAQLQTVQDGTKIILKANDALLPPLVISKDTRITKLTKGVGSPLTVADLKPGLVVDMTLDYEKNLKVWYFRDVYVSTDRNPGI